MTDHESDSDLNRACMSADRSIQKKWGETRDITGCKQNRTVDIEYRGNLAREIIGTLVSVSSCWRPVEPAIVL